MSALSTQLARRSIDVPGLDRKSPAPTASRIGSLLMSGGIYGRDPADGRIPDDAAAQVKRMFANIELTLQVAGGSPGDIIKIDFIVDDLKRRILIDECWIAMFPDAASRPARHVVPASYLPSPAVVRCEIIAVLGE